jgi:hypothetical protein
MMTLGSPAAMDLLPQVFEKFAEIKKLIRKFCIEVISVACGAWRGCGKYRMHHSMG